MDYQKNQFTSQELDLGNTEIGYEWLAGSTPSTHKTPGRWIVKREPKKWVILYQGLLEGAPQALREEALRGSIIRSFPPTEEGERLAKTTALQIVATAWQGGPKGLKYLTAIWFILLAIGLAGLTTPFWLSTLPGLGTPHIIASSIIIIICSFWQLRKAKQGKGDGR